MLLGQSGLRLVDQIANTANFDEVHLSLESPFIKYEVYMSIGNIKVVANASKRHPFQINVPTFSDLLWSSLILPKYRGSVGS